MNLLWYLIAVWVGVLLISPADGLWMAAALTMIVALAWGLDALLHRNDERNRP
jgi:hypothetical protein